MKKKIYAIYIAIVFAVFSMFFIGFNANASESEGTSVPNSGYVEKLYFNTALSVEEVNNLLSQLTYEDNMYPILVAENSSDFDIEVMDLGDGYAIVEMTTQYPYFIGSQTGASQMGFSGWNVELTSYVNVNVNVDSNYGLENDKLSSLFSITPFEDTETEQKEYFYQGTAVSNSGYVENVYLNTNLSTEEVVGLLDQLDYPSVEGMGGDRNHFLYSEDGTYQLGAINYGDGYVIGNANDNSAYFCTSESMSKYVGDFIGWNPNFNGEISINSNVLSTYLFNDYTYQIGAHNEQLSSLFSTTPFRAITKSENMSNDKPSTNNPVKIDLSISNIDFNIKHLIGITSTSILVYGLYKVLTMKRGKKYAKKFKR